MRGGEKSLKSKDADTSQQQSDHARSSNLQESKTSKKEGKKKR